MLSKATTTKIAAILLPFMTIAGCSTQRYCHDSMVEQDGGFFYEKDGGFFYEKDGGFFYEKDGGFFYEKDGGFFYEKDGAQHSLICRRGVRVNS